MFERVAILGSNGFLGQELVKRFCKKAKVIGIDRAEKPLVIHDNYIYESCDLLEKRSVRRLFMDFEPQLVVNGAAFTHVDGCETDRELCWNLNVDLVEHIATLAKLVKAKMVHMSTDYVFDGENGPYREEDTPNPISYYGKAKLASENLLMGMDLDKIILRTMVLVGPNTEVRQNFAWWLFDSLSRDKPLTIVDDQIGNITNVLDVAAAIDILTEKGKSGVYHVAGADRLSRYDFAIALARHFGLDEHLISRVKTADLNQAARRPLNSGLIIEKLIRETQFYPQTSDEILHSIATSFQEKAHS